MFAEETPPFDRLDDLVAAAESGDDPEALVEIGALCYSDDRFEDTRRLWERAFGVLRASGDDRRAARVAIDLIDLHHGILGNVAAAHGWSAKARRLLDTIDRGPELGYFELARAACDRPDVDELLASADRAIRLASEFGDTNLEVRALADGGLALVSQGRLTEGFERLDEALASICAGEVSNPSVVGLAFCSMLSSCDRAEDVARGEEWIRLINEMVLSPTEGRPKVLHTHCRGAYGSILLSAGRWDEADAALGEALGPDSSSSVAHRVESTATLARLRVAQGRFDDAAALLGPQEDQLPTCLPMAEMYLRRGSPDLAAAVAERGLAELVGDTRRRCPLLVLLVEARIASGDLVAAAQAADWLDRLAASSEGSRFETERAVSRARLCRANGQLEAAIEAGESGIASIPADRDSLIGGILRFELASALAAGDESARAVIQARAAASVFERLAAAGWSERTAALLRQLGHTPVPASGFDAAVGLDALTEREREVLRLVCRGSTNAEIGRELFISAKTVEHHVGRILSKLGVRSRTEAAAMVAGIDLDPHR